MFASRAIVFCAMAITLCPLRAHAISSTDHSAVILNLCSRVIREYSAFLAGKSMPHNINALEREYEYCSELIDGLEILEW